MRHLANICLPSVELTPARWLSAVLMLLFQIYQFQNMLVAENPTLVSKQVIGKSYEGRDLTVLKVKRQK